MAPRVLVVDASRPEAEAIAEAVAVLRRGGLVAIPTETVYGLAGRALDPEAIARIFAAKGRPRSHPLIAHVATSDDARALAREWPEAAERLAREFFPGPLTLVVPRAERVPAELAAGGPTVAIRAPAHPVARALIAALGEPIAAPSANRYQSVSPTTATHVLRSLGERVDLVLDAGPTTHGIESSVVDVSVSPPRLLRPGALAVADLRRVVPDLVVREGLVTSAQHEVRASPGMDARHYAPRAHVELVEGQARALARAQELSHGEKRVAVVLRSPVHSVHADARVSVAVLGASPEEYAAKLFAVLHDADAGGADVIVVEAVPTTEEWLAVRDRLRRARA